ncbi:MAG: hypothetical protein WC275_04680, partial [Bacilli bacterium]
MNKKNKVLLSTVGLLLLSGIAATSSTFAWFTTVRTAKVNFGDAEVVTKSGNLAISYVTSANTGVTSTQTAEVVTITGTNKVTDISGDGKTFYKPVWADSIANVASVINDVTATADGHYVDFTIKVSRENDIDDNGLKVYLGEGTEIVGKTDSDPDQLALNNSVVAATRLAVLDDEGEVILRWAPEAETPAKYLVAGTGAYSTTTHQLENDTELKSGEISDYTTIAAADAAGYRVADLASGTTTETEITFRAWIEGEDAQTVNDIIGGVFNVNIAL